MRDAKKTIEPDRLDAVARLILVFTAMTLTDRTKLHPSYQRLMEAAAKLRGVHGEAALTTALHSTDQQKINNWQRRGVSKDGALDAERFIGCPAVYILDGTIPPCDEWQRLRAAQQAGKPIPPYERDDVRQLRELAQSMDPESVRALVMLMKKL